MIDLKYTLLKISGLGSITKKNISSRENIHIASKYLPIIPEKNMNIYFFLWHYRFKHAYQRMTSTVKGNV